MSGKGYRVLSVPSHFEYEDIRSRLEKPGFWKEISVLETVDSTNTYLLNRADSGVTSAIAVADAQISGRGRMGRRWHSPPGKNIYMSMLVPLRVPPAKAPVITIVAGLSVASVLWEDLGIDCRVKWPNDVYLGGKKVCGILSDMVAELDATRCVIIGIGINVNSDSRDFPGEFRERVISLKEFSGKDIMRVDLLCSIIDRLMGNLERFARDGFEVFLDEWNRYSYLKGKTVIVDTGEGEVRGEVKGIHPERGYMMVESPDGKSVEVVSGRVRETGEN